MNYEVNQEDEYDFDENARSPLSERLMRGAWANMTQAERAERAEYEAAAEQARAERRYTNEQKLRAISDLEETLGENESLPPHLVEMRDRLIWKNHQARMARRAAPSMRSQARQRQGGSRRHSASTSSGSSSSSSGDSDGGDGDGGDGGDGDEHARPLAFTLPTPNTPPPDAPTYLPTMEEAESLCRVYNQTLPPRSNLLADTTVAWLALRENPDADFDVHEEFIREAIKADRHAEAPKSRAPTYRDQWGAHQPSEPVAAIDHTQPLPPRLDQSSQEWADRTSRAAEALMQEVSSWDQRSKGKRGGSRGSLSDTLRWLLANEDVRTEESLRAATRAGAPPLTTLRRHLREMRERADELREAMTRGPMQGDLFGMDDEGGLV